MKRGLGPLEPRWIIDNDAEKLTEANRLLASVPNCSWTGVGVGPDTFQLVATVRGYEDPRVHYHLMHRSVDVEALAFTTYQRLAWTWTPSEMEVAA